MAKSDSRFKPAEKGCGSGSMAYLKNGREALSQVDDRPLWWRIHVRGADRRVVSVNNLDAPSGRFIPFADAATGGQFIWKNTPVAGVPGTLDVTVTVRLESGSSLARFRIAVANHLENASLWDIHFPYVNHLGYPGQSDVLVPSTHSMMVNGELHRAATGILYASYLGAPYVDYPGGGFPIGHMSATIGDNSVVYVGCHDPLGNTKGYGWKIEEGLRFHVPPPHMASPGKDYQQEWDYCIGPMDGDWFDAAVFTALGRLSSRGVPRAGYGIALTCRVRSWRFRIGATPMARGRVTASRQSRRTPKRPLWTSNSRPPAGLFDPSALAYDVQRDEMLRRNEKSIEVTGLPLGIQ